MKRNATLIFTIVIILSVFFVQGVNNPVLVQAQDPGLDSSGGQTEATQTPSENFLPEEVPTPQPPSTSSDLEVSATNLISNGSFESGTSLPTSWQKDAWNSSYSTFTWDSAQKYLGTKSVKIANNTADDARWIQTVTVQANTDYRLSGWIKTSNVAHSSDPVDAGANISLYGTYTYSTPLFGTNDWTYVSFNFNSGSSTSVVIACRLGYWSGTNTGTAWFDDIQLQELNTPTTAIQNPGFESGTSTQPDNWWTETIKGSATYTWDASVFHAGAKSVKVVATGQSIARWTQTVLLTQDSEYQLSGWVKTSNVQDPDGQTWVTGAKIGIYGTNSYLAAATPGIKDTADWTYVTVNFVTGSATIGKIACTLGEADSLISRSTSSGTMWCDDLKLTKIRTLGRTKVNGAHVAFNIYTDNYKLFSDPTTYISHLDEVYNAMKYLMNGVPSNGAVITVKSDASMYYGLLSGNPITIGPDSNWPAIVNAHGIDFGVPHELGHDFDLSPQNQLYMGQMTFDGAEQWANLKVLYAYDVLAKKYPDLTDELWGVTVPLNQVGKRFVDVQAQPWIDSGRKDYKNMSNDVYTGLLYSLKQRVGWNPFIKTFYEYSTTSISVPTTDEAKVALFAYTLSKNAGTDLVRDFRSWGFPIKPTKFAKTSPSSGVTGRSAAVNLNWGVSYGVTRYEYCYDTSNDNACTNWVSTGTAHTKTVSGLKPSTTYYWQVRAVNSNGVTYANGSSTSYWSFKTGTLPAAFSKSSPASGAVKQPASVTLKWGTSSGATAYLYCIDTTNDNACSNWVSVGTATSKTVTNLKANTSYYWQVKSTNSFGTRYGNGTSTAFWTFKTGPLPASFNKSSPANKAVNQPSSITLKWSASANASSYQVCYDTTNDNACSNWVSAGTATSKTITGLTAGLTYYWQVRAVNGNGSTYANTATWWSFTRSK